MGRLSAATLTALRCGDAVSSQGLLQKLASGAISLTPAVADEPVTLLVVSPDSIFSAPWRVVTLQRDRSRFILDVEQWEQRRPVGPERDPRPRSVSVLSLGQLSEGAYDLRVEWCVMTAPAASSLPLYEWRNLKAASVHCDVEAGGGLESIAPSSGGAAALDEADFKVLSLPDADVDIQYQEPQSAYRTLRGKATSPPGLRLGSFDLETWAEKSPGLLRYPGDLPILETPSEREPLFAVILGPPLADDEWMSLRSVEWDGTRCSLRVEIWQQSCNTPDRRSTRPLLVVPIARAATNTLPSRVDVLWSVLCAAEPGDAYSLSEEFPGDSMESAQSSVVLDSGAEDLGPKNER